MIVTHRWTTSYMQSSNRVIINRFSCSFSFSSLSLTLPINRSIDWWEKATVKVWSSDHSCSNNSFTLNDRSREERRKKKKKKYEMRKWQKRWLHTNVQHGTRSRQIWQIWQHARVKNHDKKSTKQKGKREHRHLSRFHNINDPWFNIQFLTFSSTGAAKTKKNHKDSENWSTSIDLRSTVQCRWFLSHFLFLIESIITIVVFDLDACFYLSLDRCLCLDV